jgi:hypothetical protein
MKCRYCPHIDDARSLTGQRDFARAQLHQVAHTQVAPIPFRTWVGPTWCTKGSRPNAAAVGDQRACVPSARALARHQVCRVGCQIIQHTSQLAACRFLGPSRSKLHRPGSCWGGLSIQGNHCVNAARSRPSSGRFWLNSADLTSTPNGRRINTAVSRKTRGQAR